MFRHGFGCFETYPVLSPRLFNTLDVHPMTTAKLKSIKITRCVILDAGMALNFTDVSIHSVNVRGAPNTREILHMTRFRMTYMCNHVFSKAGAKAAGTTGIVERVKTTDRYKTESWSRSCY